MKVLSKYYRNINLLTLVTSSPLSKEKIAEHLDIASPYLSSILNCKRRPSDKILKKACKLFNVKFESFDQTSMEIQLAEEIVKVNSAVNLDAVSSILSIREEIKNTNYRCSKSNNKTN